MNRQRLAAWAISSVTSTATILAFAAALFGSVSGADSGSSWDAKSVARYLDRRVTETDCQCMSCHTTLTYALARPGLRRTLHETEPSPVERGLLDRIRKRVRLGPDAPPILGGKQRGPATESVLNALILVTDDMPSGALSAETKVALKTMWDLQLRSGERAGAWPWFGDSGGGEEPWEAYDSQYWGAVFAAIVVGRIPEGYRTDKEIQNNLKWLKAYLKQGRREQSLLNRLALVWANENWPGLFTIGEQESIVREIISHQHADGGWSAAELISPTWKRLDGTPQETRSDGFATGFAVCVVSHSGVVNSRTATGTGRLWLVRNQNREVGSWPGYSLNKKRDPASDVGQFMTDAATAYAVMALMPDS